MNPTNSPQPYTQWADVDFRSELEKLNAALSHLSNAPKTMAEVNAKIKDIQGVLFANKFPAQRLDIAEQKLKQAAAQVAKAKEALQEHVEKKTALNQRLAEAQRSAQEGQSRLNVFKAAVAAEEQVQAEGAVPDLTQTSANLVKAFMPPGVSAVVSDQISIVMNAALAQLQTQVANIVQEAQPVQNAQQSQQTQNQAIPRPNETSKPSSTVPRNSNSHSTKGIQPQCPALADPWHGR